MPTIDLTFQPAQSVQISVSKIAGVRIIALNDHHSSEDQFTEVDRPIRGISTHIPHYSLHQISFSQTIPNSIKAFHLHKYQNDLWFIPPKQKVLVGLIDVRKTSKTYRRVNRFYLGQETSELLYVPKGVAHGYVNYGQQEMNIIYFADKTYNSNQPDEYYLDKNILGAEFWKQEK